MVTASIVDIAQQVKTNIIANATSLGISKQLNAAQTPCVFYGDQEFINGSIVVCVEPATKVRTFDGYPNQTLNNFSVRVIAYVEKVDDDETTRLRCDQLAEALEHLLHSDLQLGGLVIQSLVSRIDFGYANRAPVDGGATRLLRAATLTYEPLTKTAATLP